MSDGQKVRRGWGRSDRNLFVFLHRVPMMLTRPKKTPAIQVGSPM